MVQWELIEKALVLFGYVEFILSTVRTLFNNIKSCVLNAGYTSQYFYPSGGIRQGCCCSPSLFTLAVELLAIIVRKTENFQGITIQGKCATISKYTDNATFFIKIPVFLLHLLDLLDEFSRFSVLKIKRHKSHLFLLGYHLHPPNSLWGIQVKQTVKILGMTYKTHMQEDEQYTLNYEQRFKKINNICNT